MILLPTLALAALLPVQSERIVMLDGTPMIGTLEAATLDEVRWSSKDGTEHSMPGNEILAILPTVGTELLRQGEELAAQLDWANAAASFEAAAGEDGPFWLKPWAGLRWAECLLRAAGEDAGPAGSAAEAFGRWCDANPDSWWLPRARIGQARALSVAGRTDQASNLMQGVADLAFEKNLPEHIELEAALARCEAFLRGNQVDVAEARLRDVASKADQGLTGDLQRGVRNRVAELRAEARILLGGAIRAKSGMPAAVAYWEGLASDPRTVPDVRAAAWTGLAAAAREAGRLREAQALLGRVVSTLPAGPEVMGRALFELGDLAQEAGDRPVAGKTYFKIILDRYPQSSWAAKARARIGG